MGGRPGCPPSPFTGWAHTLMPPEADLGHPRARSHQAPLALGEPWGQAIASGQQVTGTTPWLPQDGGTGTGPGSLLSPALPPPTPALAELQRPLLGAPPPPPLLPTRGHSSSPQRAVIVDSPAPPEAVSAAQSAPLAPGPLGLERWPAGSASRAPQGTYLPGVRSGCRVSGLSSVCE